MYDNKQLEHVIKMVNRFEENTFNPMNFIIFFIPENEESDIPRIYLTLVMLNIKPTLENINNIIFETKESIGNIIFACEYKILTKNEAIMFLEELIS